MVVVINTLGAKAELGDDGWTSENAEVTKILNEKTELVEIATSVPNPPLAIAQAIVSDFGGEIVSYDHIESDPEADQ